MSARPPAERLLAEHLQASLVGRLVNGIVHNMNGPMQILSMQIELFRRDAERNLATLQTAINEDLSDNVLGTIEGLISQVRGSLAKLDQMETTLNRLEGTIDVIAKRCRGASGAAEVVVVPQILEEEMAFWQGDLFFKHQVEKKLDITSESLFVRAEERDIRYVIDAVVAACIEQLRGTHTRSLFITASKEDDACLIRFHHTGVAFPLNWVEIATDVFSVGAQNENGFDPHSTAALALHMAFLRAGETRGTLDVRPQEVIYSLPRSSPFDIDAPCL